MKIGEVVWYATGRFYSNEAADGTTTLQDAGYFLHLAGIDAPLFAGAPSESSAYFTFASAPFASSTVANGPLTIGLDATGSFELYLRDTPGASFDEPESFAAGRCIATFERLSIVATSDVETTATTALLSNVFTARLVSSQTFRFGDRDYDLRDMIGDGITQWGVAASQPLPPPPGFASAVPFVGSAIRIG